MYGTVHNYQDVWRRTMPPHCERGAIMVEGNNKLLSLLPREELDRLEPHLEDFPLEYKFLLYEASGMIADVYFPRSGVISLVTVMQNGEQLEIATVGNEGMAGLPVFLGSTTSPIRTLCQIPGSAWKMKAEIFREHI
jgi:CRP-like cAMP-binding protein